jgi:hypothetical protein
MFLTNLDLNRIRWVSPDCLGFDVALYTDSVYPLEEILSPENVLYVLEEIGKNYEPDWQKRQYLDIKPVLSPKQIKEIAEAPGF